MRFGSFPSGAMLARFVFVSLKIAVRALVEGFAQVAEWLMAADCKSAAPCELRRFESSPVHQNLLRLQMNRFGIALAAYVLIGTLAWFTLSDQKIRLVTLILIGAFALRTLTLHARRRTEEAKQIR